MRNIKMIMPKLQLNSKFVNNMLPEWGRVVTAVKLNRGLRESNYNQLFAYLKQHEAHAKENKMALERLSQPIAQPTADPLALLSNVSNTQHGSPSSSTSSITPVTPPRANSTDTVQDGRVVVQNVQGQPNRDQGMNPWGGNAAGYGEAQNRVRNVNRGQARPGQARTVKCYNCSGAGHIVRNCTQPKRPQNSEYFKDNMLLMQGQENRVALDAEQLLFLADRNFKEEALKRELHSTKLQLTSTINRNKSMVEETTFLKQDFKQKENKLLADFLNMKSLKEKVEDRLVKQDQSLQTFYMLCRPRPLYNDLNKVAIGYKNPLCLT
nr:hypothetical protein [Tanacetum cinerariifolium]